ncbi:MAG: hypothetical protein ACK4NY_18010 [Spirosomataceae bacterium]
MLEKEDLNQFQEMLNKETDRGLVLVAASFIDFCLQNLLLSKLTIQKKDEKEIFSGNGFLSTFSSKIKLAKAIELIDETTFKNIEVVRKIRNQYAHTIKDKTLKGYKDDVNNMSIPPIGVLNDTRKTFINGVLVILASLQSASILYPTFNEINSNLHQWYKSRSILEKEFEDAKKILE